MASNKPFAFDVQKLNKLLNGNIGIADKIHELQIKPILDAISDPIQKDAFLKLSEPNQKAGLHAMEGTVISSMLESYKPVIELAKICLELFGGFEYTIATLAGGPNPENDPNSFIGALNANKAEMDTFPTGMSNSSNSGSGTEPALPPVVFLGQFRRDLPTGNIYSYNSVPLNNEFTIGVNWPQFQDYNDFYNESINIKLLPKINTLDAATQQTIIDGRTDSMSDEWDEMEDDAQLKANFQNDFGPGVDYIKYYKPVETQYLNETIEIDIEGDYDVVVNKTTDDQLLSANPYYHDTFYIYATIKPDAVPNTNPGATKSPANFAGGKIIKAIKAFLKRVLPIITKKLIPIITAIQQLLSNPVEFIGQILMTKLKEKFEMFDPSIKSLPKNDPKRKRYWSDDTFVLDGIAVIDVGLIAITLGLKDGLPTFQIGKQTLPPGTKEQPLLKQVANIVALPINFLKGLIDSFKELMKKFFKVKELGNVVPDFLSFQWVKDLMGKEKLFEFLGAPGGDITKIPFLQVPSEGMVELVPGMINAFLKMILSIINGFITIPNTIFNLELVPAIPLPD